VLHFKPWAPCFKLRTVLYFKPWAINMCHISSLLSILFFCLRVESLTIKLCSTELGTVFCLGTHELFAIKSQSFFESYAHRDVLQAVGHQYVRHAVLLRPALQPVRQAGHQVVCRVVFACMPSGFSMHRHSESYPAEVLQTGTT
jgi:hypothetical protein